MFTIFYPRSFSFLFSISIQSDSLSNFYHRHLSESLHSSSLCLLKISTGSHKGFSGSNMLHKITISFPPSLKGCPVHAHFVWWRHYSFCCLKINIEEVSSHMMLLLKYFEILFPLISLDLCYLPEAWVIS